MGRLNNIFPQHNRMTGYTLVELIVAIAIVSITILSLVVLLRKGSEITTTDIHRKRARALIDSCFESASYHCDNYSNFISVNRAVLIDPRVESNTGDNVNGTLTVSVVVDTNNSTGTLVQYKQLTVSVQWPEPEGAQTITLMKQVTLE